jgi:putative flippase GtrA
MSSKSMGVASNELARFVIVGIANNGLLFITYIALTKLLFLDPKLSMTITYSLGILIGYFMHGNVTFIDSEFDNSSFLRFILSHGLAYVLNLLILLLFVDYFGFSHVMVQGVAVLTIAILLFLLMKYFVFRTIKDKY